MRCHAYQLPSDVYHELEAQILEQLRDGDHSQLRHLLSDHDLDVELLSGEWRILMGEIEEHYQVIELDRRIARMCVSPGELAEFVEQLRLPERQARWGPISFGIAELTDALPVGTDLVGVVFVEESDDWLWAEPVCELVAIRPEVFELLEPYLRAQMEAGDHSAMARFAEDHAEGSVEFSPEQWRVLMRHSRERVPELVSVYEAKLSKPKDYTSIREALSLVADPRYQPSLDAWLRVHAAEAQYALYFRDAGLERRELEGSGLFQIGRNTQKMKRVPPPGTPPQHQLVPAEDVPLEEYRAGKTIPMKVAERDRAARNTDGQTDE